MRSGRWGRPRSVIPRVWSRWLWRSCSGLAPPQTATLSPAFNSAGEDSRAPVEARDITPTRAPAVSGRIVDGEAADDAINPNGRATTDLRRRGRRRIDRGPPERRNGGEAHVKEITVGFTIVTAQLNASLATGLATARTWIGLAQQLREPHWYEHLRRSDRRHRQRMCSGSGRGRWLPRRGRLRHPGRAVLPGGLRRRSLTIDRPGHSYRRPGMHDSHRPGVDTDSDGRARHPGDRTSTIRRTGGWDRKLTGPDLATISSSRAMAGSSAGAAPTNRLRQREPVRW